MSTKVKAIVLGGTNIKEKDRIIQLFSLEKGKISASMKGVRGDKAKLKSAKEPFCFGEFIIEEGKNSNIVTSVDITDNFYDIIQNIDKYYEGCAILDVVNKVALEPNPQLFIELIKSLKTLCYDNVKKLYVIDKFLISVFGAMGYNFLTDKCSSCGGKLSNKYLNLEIGEIVCPACRTNLSISISNPCYSALRVLNITDYERLSSVKIGGNGEIQLYHLFCQNFEWRTGLKLITL